jgi:hypothetical protein
MDTTRNINKGCAHELASASDNTHFVDVTARLQARHPMELQLSGVQERLTFPWLGVAHGAIQTIIVAILCTIVVTTKLLPTNIDARHDVYHNLESATARMLLPRKVTTFPLLTTNTDNTSTNVASQQVSSLPPCGGFSDAGLPATATPTEMPDWMLPDDESSMNDMLCEMVCHKISTELPSYHQNCFVFHHTRSLFLSRRL